MERSARHRRSKSASGFEGIHQIPKYRTLSRLSPDYASYIDGSTRDDMYMVERGQSSSARATERPMEKPLQFMVGRGPSSSARATERPMENPLQFMVERGQSSSARDFERPMAKPLQFMVERGQSSSGRATDRPMAKLLAEKMFKEIEPKSRSISAIARLMRLEGLHSLWNVNKQKRRLSDDHRQNDVSINTEPNRQLYDGRYNRRSPMKEQQFNDVYEDLDASGFVKPRRSSRWSASSMPTKSEMGLVRKKLDAKHLFDDESSDEKLEDSRELDDTLYMLDSRDLLMKYARKRDSLFANQRVNPSSSLKPSNSGKYEGNAKAWIPDRNTTGDYGLSSHPERCDGLLLEPHNRHGARIFQKISNIQLEEKKKKDMLPRPIVVLRPNIGNMQTASGRGSSSYHSHGCNPDFRKMKEYPSVGGAEEISWRRNDSYYDAEFSKPNSNEARKLAREITRRIRDACDESEDATYSGFREYIGDESLYDVHRSDFNNEPEMFKWSSRNSSVDDNKWGRHPSSGSLSREGKRRLLERWEITHRYRDLDLVGDPSTLGEVLAVPDGETRSKNYAYKGNNRSSTRLGIDSGSSILGGPLGITSRGGPKNETQRTSSRSRSLPPIGGRTHRRDSCHDVFAEEKHLMHSDPISSGRSKVVKGYPIHKNFHLSQGSKSRSKKPLPCPPMFIKELESSLEATFEIQMEANVKDFPEQQLSFQMAEKDDCSGGSVSDIMIDKQGITTLPSKSSLLHLKNSSVDDKSSAAHDQEDFCVQGLHHGPPEEGSPSLHQLDAEPVSSESFKDAGYASPISVFEVPYVEDASSSSESFGRVSAELNELRMKLQLLKLLKLESGAYDEISTLITIGKDVAYPSSSAESWEVSYTLDVLIQSGFQDFGFDMFKIMWNYPDCPLDPGLFDNLEKKYGDDISELRSERMLLFDRINSALSEIFQKHVDLCPWLMPKLAGLLSTRAKERAKDALEKLISQESAHWLVTESIVLRDMQWTGPTEEIALMINEIEKLLMDDMITELLCE